MLGFDSFNRSPCAFLRFVLLVARGFASGLNCSTLRRSVWGGALGCDDAIEENGYPLGSDSSVSISCASRGREFATLFGDCWRIRVFGRFVGLRLRLSFLRLYASYSRVAMTARMVALRYARGLMRVRD